ncbi:MAG: hypothetical protein K8T91_22420 [Planctomycetes bacterium]|nr:hypothetical protein [Planctomycetota bacterium]
MKRQWIKGQWIKRQWLRVCMGSLLGCAVAMTAVAAEPPSSENPAAQKKEIAGTPYGDLIIGEPIVYKNLTIVPVSSKVPKTADRFITPDEGLRSGKVKIVEVGAEAAPAAPAARHAPAQQQQGRQQARQPQAPAQQAQPQPESAEVNRLMVINSSDKPLYLMPGEVISGGKQDRTIGQELVIQPGKKPVPIEVFCVEHGRWSGRDAAATNDLVFESNVLSSRAQTAESAATERATISEKAKKGEFAGSVGQLNKSARIAVQGDKDQGKVWEKVAENNTKSGAQTGSGNFAANYAQKDVADRLKPYIEQCGKPVLARSQVVGVVVAINGKVESVDIFESTPLFTKLYDKLLKSFALDAATAADSKATIVACPPEACVKFLKEAEKSPVAKSEVNADLKAVHRESPSVITFTAGENAKSDAQGGFGGGAFGGGIHTGAFSK